MPPTEQRQVRALGLDAGGTMTDTILVDARGQFVVGKAQTTPADEAVGFSQSVVDALGYWGIEPDEAFASMVSGVYSGTSMLNRLLERKGGRIGLLVTRGMEDVLKLEQGIQTWLGFSYADTLHMVTHRHHEPLVPRSRIRGVGGRIDVGGNEVIPLYEDDAREGMRDLIGADLDCVCIDLLFSWRNPVHEQRTKEIALEVLREAGVDIPVLISSEVCPKRGELARLNTLVIDAYAAEPSRQQLQSVRDRTRQLGAGFDLRVMSSSGDTISIDAPQLVSTLVSGPIGGCVGARYLSEQLGEPNIACGDVGGTSFDVALVMDGQTEIRLDPDVAHFKLAVPMVRMDSVGAGTGTLVRINPVSRRIELGPDSAASKVGVSNPQADIETVSITDCDVVLGRIDPDYFLGGELKLDRDRAVAAVREQLAKPLALGVEAAAAGVVDLFEAQLARQLESTVMGQGFGPADFSLLAYGGGGPGHAAGFSAPLSFKDVLIPSWAAAFSAFGCVCGDFAYRADQQIDHDLPTDLTDPGDVETLGRINGVWHGLRDRITAQFAKSGIAEDKIVFRPGVRMQYRGQLKDIEIAAPTAPIEDEQALRMLVDTFERTFGKVYADAARSPELGYFITLGIMTGAVAIERPLLPSEPISPDATPDTAQKSVRDVFVEDRWHATPIYDMDALDAGVHLRGPAVIEAPSTTLYVPPDRGARLDEHRIFHMSKNGDRS